MTEPTIYPSKDQIDEFINKLIRRESHYFSEFKNYLDEQITAGHINASGKDPLHGLTKEILFGVLPKIFKVSIEFEKLLEEKKITTELMDTINDLLNKTIEIIYPSIEKFAMEFLFSLTSAEDPLSPLSDEIRKEILALIVMLYMCRQKIIERGEEWIYELLKEEERGQTKH